MNKNISDVKSALADCNSILSKIKNTPFSIVEIENAVLHLKIHLMEMRNIAPDKACLPHKTPNANENEQSRKGRIKKEMLERFILAALHKDKPLQLKNIKQAIYEREGELIHTSTLSTRLYGLCDKNLVEKVSTGFFKLKEVKNEN